MEFLLSASTQIVKRTLVGVLCLCLVACSPLIAPGRNATAQFDHIAISVANANASAEFYKGIFGLTELKNPFVGGGGVVWLDLGNGIALHIFGDRSTRIANERERHFAIAVHDISKVTDYLAARGLTWQDFEGAKNRVQTRPDGVRQLFFQDPDGYWVEVNDALARPIR